MLFLIGAVLTICWLKRRHEEDLRLDSELIVSKDEIYQKNRSSLKLRRSLVG